MGRSENVRCKLGVTPGENSDHVREPDELDHRAITAIASFFLSSTWPPSACTAVPLLHPSCDL